MELEGASVSELDITIEFDAEKHKKLLVFMWGIYVPNYTVYHVLRGILGTVCIGYGMYSWSTSLERQFFTVFALFVGGYFLGDAINRIYQRERQMKEIHLRANQIVEALDSDVSTISMKFDTKGLHHKDASQENSYFWKYVEDYSFQEDNYLLILFKNGHVYGISKAYVGAEAYSRIVSFVQNVTNTVPEMKTGTSDEVLDD